MTDPRLITGGRGPFIREDIDQQAFPQGFVSDKSRVQLYSQLKPLIKKLPDPSWRRQLDDIFTETDSQIFWQDLHQLGLHSRQCPAPYGAGRGECDELAVTIFQLIQHSPEAPAEIQKKAEAEANAIIGKGSVGMRIEYLSERFVRQATDYKMIVPMIGGSMVYQGVRAAGLLGMAGRGAAWWTRGMVARGIVGTAGYAAEVPVFVGMGRGLRSLAGDPLGPLAPELASGAITLGVLKLFSFVGNQAFHRLHRINELGGATRLKGISKLNRPVFPQVSAFGGLMIGHRLEVCLGLRPSVEDATAITDTLSTMVSLGVGSKLGHQVLGQKFNHKQQELGMKAEIYFREAHRKPTIKEPHGPASGKILGDHSFKASFLLGGIFWGRKWIPLGPPGGENRSSGLKLLLPNGELGAKKGENLLAMEGRPGSGSKLLEEVYQETQVQLKKVLDQLELMDYFVAVFDFPDRVKTFQRVPSIRALDMLIDYSTKGLPEKIQAGESFRRELKEILPEESDQQINFRVQDLLFELAHILDQASPPSQKAIVAILKWLSPFLWNDGAPSSRPLQEVIWHTEKLFSASETPLMPEFFKMVFLKLKVLETLESYGVTDKRWVKVLHLLLMHSHYQLANKNHSSLHSLNVLRTEIKNKFVDGTLPEFFEEVLTLLTLLEAGNLEKAHVPELTSILQRFLKQTRSQVATQENARPRDINEVLQDLNLILIFGNKTSENFQRVLDLVREPREPEKIAILKSFAAALLKRHAWPEALRRYGPKNLLQFTQEGVPEWVELLGQVEVHSRDDFLNWFHQAGDKVFAKMLPLLPTNILTKTYIDLFLYHHHENSFARALELAGTLMQRPDFKDIFPWSLDLRLRGEGFPYRNAILAELKIDQGGVVDFSKFNSYALLNILQFFTPPTEISLRGNNRPKLYRPVIAEIIRLLWVRDEWLDPEVIGYTLEYPKFDYAVKRYLVHRLVTQGTLIPEEIAEGKLGVGVKKSPDDKNPFSLEAQGLAWTKLYRNREDLEVLLEIILEVRGIRGASPVMDRMFHYLYKRYQELEGQP